MTDASDFEEWIGRERVSRDDVTLARARELAATLDRDPNALHEGGPLPHGWHWIYFHEAVPRSALADDGHERRGDFLPPIPLARRMWAGGRLRFERSLTIGAELERRSAVRSVTFKEGRTGPLAFVTVEHRLSDGDGVLLDEEQDIVYLDRRPPDSERDRRAQRGDQLDAAVTRDSDDWVESFVADEVTLFRFSALTFNGHRIHYDRSYAVDVEGYPDLVVHGPLLALLLLDLGVRRLEEHPGGAQRVRFTYRGLQPLFCNERVELRASISGGEGAEGGLDLRAVHAERGWVTRAQLRSGG